MKSKVRVFCQMIWPANLSWHCCCCSQSASDFSSLFSPRKYRVSSKEGGCQVVIEYKSNRKKKLFSNFSFSVCVYMCLSLKNIGLTSSTTLELSRGFKLYLLLFHYISKTYNDLIKY